MISINKEKIKEKQRDRMSTTSTNLKRYEEMLKKFSKYSLTIEIVLVLVSTVFAIYNYNNENSSSFQFSIIMSLTLPISLVYLHLFHNKNDVYHNVRNAYLQIDELFTEIDLLEADDCQFDYKYELICIKYQNAISKTENVPSEIYLIERIKANDSKRQQNEENKENIGVFKKFIFKNIYNMKLFFINMGVDLIILTIYLMIYYIV